jgi:hypothetical protein
MQTIIPIILNSLATIALLAVLVPVVFRGKLNNTAEICFLIGGIWSLSIAPLIIIAEPSATIVLHCIGSASLLLSKQGRAFLAELFLLPLDLTANIFRRTKNLFLEEAVERNRQLWIDRREVLYSMLRGVPNQRM